jgi:hypothetical protein
VDKLINSYNIGRYSIKTMPKTIPVFAFIYSITVSLLIYLFNVLNFTPVHIGEYLLVLLGIILYTHLAIYEKENDIYELTYIRDKSHYYTVTIQLFYILYFCIF